MNIESMSDTDFTDRGRRDRWAVARAPRASPPTHVNAKYVLLGIAVAIISVIIAAAVVLLLVYVLEPPKPSPPR